MRGLKQLESGDIWVADSETDPFDGKTIPKPFVWGLYNGVEYHQFDTVRQFVDFVKVRKIICFAHNGGKFDYHFLLDELEPETTLRIIHGRIAQFWIGECEFRDSYNIMPMPLAAVQKEIVDYERFKKDVRDLPENYHYIRDYLRSDCVNLFNMVATFIREFGLHLTQASASIDAWQRISGEKKPRTSNEFYNCLAPYYHGGRVECFKKGIIETPTTLIDINSSYPFAMMHALPWGTGIDEIGELPDNDDYLARCFISLEAVSCGAFPFKRADGALVFPNDGARRVFHITGWEYIAARDTGHLRESEVLTILALPLTIEFSAYLDHFYHMKVTAKQTGDKARYEFAKRFYNSVYGKMGANPAKYEEFKLIEPDYIDACEGESTYRFSDTIGRLALMARPLSEQKQFFLNVGTAASVTGFGRANLWRGICGSGGVVYCDTDCILCELPSPSLPMHPTELGAWDIEGQYDFAAVAGKKMYALRESEEWHSKKRAKDKDAKKWKTASKGVKLSHLQIIQVARGETITYNPIAPTFSLGRAPTHVKRKIRMT